MFGISYGEVALIMAAAFAVFGPKDIPLIARAAGRFSGRAVGYIQSARGSLDGVMQRDQVKQVHKELQETMAQLEAIRYEINSGISLVNPGPLTRRIVNADSPGARPFNSPTEAEPGEMKGSDLHSRHIVNKQDGLGLGTEIASEMYSLQHATSVPPSITRIAVPRVEMKLVAEPAMAQELGFQSRETIQDITVIPISALSAGLLPVRTEINPRGSELVYEAIVERKVAFDTLEFFKQAESFLK